MLDLQRVEIGFQTDIEFVYFHIGFTGLLIPFQNITGAERSGRKVLRLDVVGDKAAEELDQVLGLVRTVLA